MIKYVLGFAFSRDGQQIVTIQKDHPEWQKGKINVPGGVIQAEDNSPMDAMRRKFIEEAGVDIPENKTHAWNMFQHFATIYGVGYEVCCFKVFTNMIYESKTITSEKITIFPVLGLGSEEFDKHKPAPHFLSLIGLAKDENLGISFIYHKNYVHDDMNSGVERSVATAAK